MNSITEKQDTEPMLRLLRARGHIYDEAQRLQVAQIAVTLVLPVLGAVVGLIITGLRPYVATLALAATLVDIVWLDRAQKTSLKLAALVSEMFDCAVLEMPWNDFVVGKKPDPEVVEAKARASSRSDAKLREWYAPREIGLAPLFLARIICQRENLWYNSSLRRRAGAFLVTLAATAVGLLWLTGLIVGLPLPDFVITLVVPASPIATWALREYFRQKDTADALEQIKSSAETLWAKAATSGCDEAVCAARSRKFQDAIFLRRATSPLPIPWLYDYVRARMDMEMAAGAADHLRQIGVSVPSDEQAVTTAAPF